MGFSIGGSLYDRSVLAGGRSDHSIDYKIHDCHKAIEQKGSLCGAAHGAGVVEAMEKYRGKVSQQEIPGLSHGISVIGAQPCSPIKYAHKNGKAKMTGDRKQSAGKDNG